MPHPQGSPPPTVVPVGERRMSLAPRLFKKCVVGQNGCVEWTGSKHDGYGYLQHNGKRVRAHRAAWFLYYGEYPPNHLDILHSCDNRACIAKNHLSVGTPRENAIDMRDRNRELRGERNHAAKLTLRQAAEIKSRAKAGAVHRDLAREFNVTPTMIGYIASGKKWARAIERDLDG